MLPPNPNRTPQAIGIWALIGFVALFDFWTSASLIGASLFSLPLALCAAQGSKRLLSSATAVVVALTIAAAIGGFDRGHEPGSWSTLASRCLLAVSLLTLAAFVRRGLTNNQKQA